MRRILRVKPAVVRGVIVGAILGAPVGVYIHTFGTRITDDPNLWSAMGSAMSGIYGPILSALTFLILINQVRLQEQTNKHMFDQSYLQDARADIEFYLTRLADILDKPSEDGVKPRDALKQFFERASVEQLNSQDLSAVAYAAESRWPQLQSIWHAIYSIYAGLNTHTGFPYDLPYSTAKQKTVVLVSFPTCVAMDQYLYCVMGEGRLSYKYQFSRNLESI